jgi:hypothetical protein
MFSKSGRISLIPPPPFSPLFPLNPPPSPLAQPNRALTVISGWADGRAAFPPLNSLIFSVVAFVVSNGWNLAV